MRLAFWLPRFSGRLVADVRLEMLERGFSLVSTPWFFDDELFSRLKTSKTLRPCHPQQWWRYPQLARYACWLERLLGQALPEESLSLAALEFRREPAGYADQEVDELHTDGSYVRTVYTLYGLSTVYRDGKRELPVPRGQTLLMTAIDRARSIRVPCTLHRRPGAGPERAVIVCSFDSRRQEPQAASITTAASACAAHRPPRRWARAPVPSYRGRAG
jgi:hypothetical protein